MKNNVLSRLLQGRPSVAHRRLFYGAARRGGVTVISPAGDPSRAEQPVEDAPHTQTTPTPEMGSPSLPKE